MSREGETRLQRHCAAAFGYLGLFIIATATSACVSSRAPQFAPLPKPDDGSAVVYVYKRPTVLVARAASRALFANDKPIAVFDGTGKYFPHVTKERELSYAAANTTKGRILTGLFVSPILAASDLRSQLLNGFKIEAGGAYYLRWDTHWFTGAQTLTVVDEPEALAQLSECSLAEAIE